MKQFLSILLVLASLVGYAQNQSPGPNSTEGKIKALQTTKLDASIYNTFVNSQTAVIQQIQQGLTTAGTNASTASTAATLARAKADTARFKADSARLIADLANGLANNAYNNSLSNAQAIDQLRSTAADTNKYGFYTDKWSIIYPGKPDSTLRVNYHVVTYRSTLDSIIAIVKQRQNHTGSQTASTISDFVAAVRLALSGNNASGLVYNSTSGQFSISGLTPASVGLTNVQNLDQTNGSNITSGTIGLARLPGTLTNQGNSFNGPSQLLLIDSDGKLPAVDGSKLTGLSASGVPIATQPDMLSLTNNAKQVTPLGVGYALAPYGVKIDANTLAISRHTDEVTASSKQARNGISIPAFYQVYLSNPAGLTTSAGKLVASASGSAGSGVISLREPIDPTKPFRLQLGFVINDANLLKFQLTNDAKSTAIGVRATGISTAGVNLVRGVSTVFNSAGNNGGAGIPAGTTGYVSVVGDGKYITTAVIFPNSSGFANPTFQSALSRIIVPSSADDINLTQSGVDVFGSAVNSANQLNTIYLENASASSAWTSLYVQQGTLDGPLETGFNPPGFLYTSCYQENPSGFANPWVYIPGSYGKDVTDMVFYQHPNGNPGSAENQPSAQSTIHAIWDAGFLIFGSTGDSPTLASGPLGSPWGGRAGLVPRKEMVRVVRSLFPKTGKLNFVGVSMGLLNSFSYALDNPAQVNKIVGISGVTSLSSSYASSTFKTLINAGNGTWFVNTTAATGVQPDLSVNISSAQAVGVSSLPVTALTVSIPAGTTLTYSGTGSSQSQIVLATTAASGATSLSLTAPLSVSIAGSSKYDSRAYWTPINRGRSSPSATYYASPYVWKTSAAYAAGTTYNVNEIVYITNPATTVAPFLDRDPVINASRLTNLKGVYLLHGDADATVNIQQMLDFQAAYTAAGGYILTRTATGADHIVSAVYDPVSIVNFLLAP
ncbi:hypothetical protein [Spirosoma sp. KNUC1025]|uniref:hypothetical protein n=1 Tax=Spirosoma sp. KNUC1025 TaxID=2894082 RepID=UPI003868C89C|nr:hypothetical protein LN737_19160 [Spirosoma sp. KNUC1025]